jgi:cysteine desulfurase
MDGAEPPSERRIYMDYNGSAPMPAEVVKAMTRFLGCGQGNPSSGHWAAEPAIRALSNARAQVAALIGASPDEIVFTSGGTEANNMAIKGIVPFRQIEGAHIVSSAIEHDAVLQPLRFLKGLGTRISLVPVDRFGIVSPEDVAKAIRPETRLISVMHANNEIGTIQPIREIAAIGRANGIPVHSDAAQSAGKIAIDVRALGVDMLSLAAHKFGGPKGIGALYIRKGLHLTPFLHGGGHEGGRRAGTENAMLAAGFGAAAQAATGKDTRMVRAMRDRLWSGLKDHFGARIALNGHLEHRTPNTLSISFPGHVGAEILEKLPHLAATTGSACHAGCVTMSSVLIAMGRPLSVGAGTVRLSLGPGNTPEEIEEVIRDFVRVLG